jgi:hypothetical protein
MNASAPKDQSLNAYKTWMLEIAGRLTNQESGLKLTEEEWIRFWKEFWRERFRT